MISPDIILQGEVRTMVYLMQFLLSTAVLYVLLLVAVPLGRKFADYDFPPWTQAAWKLAVMAGAVAAVSMLTAPFLWFFNLVLVFAVLWLFLWKWFDADAFGAFLVTLIVVVLDVAINLLLLSRVWAH
jgi:hypothetical protein